MKNRYLQYIQPDAWRREAFLETYRSISNLLAEGLKHLILITGGAVVAFLALYSQLSTGKNSAKVATIAADALMYFCIALFVCILSFLTGYLTQICYLKFIADYDAYTRKKFVESSVSASKEIDLAYQDISIDDIQQNADKMLNGHQFYFYITLSTIFLWFIAFALGIYNARNALVAFAGIT